MCGIRPMAAPAPMPEYRGESGIPIHTSPYPTGSRAPAPTATPPGARDKRLSSTCPYSTDIRAPAPTSAPQGARLQRRVHTSKRPTDSSAPTPTAAPPGARPQRRSHRSAQPTSSRSPLPTPAARLTCKTPRYCAIPPTRSAPAPPVSSRVPARGRSEAATAVRHAPPVCARNVRSMGSKCFSTFCAKRSGKRSRRSTSGEHVASTAL
jgi:hypothetical protein